VLIAALAYVVLATPLLAVRDIRVVGSTIAGPDMVRAAAQVELGTPLARVDTDAVADRVGAIPSVAHADVYRSWPSTLVVDVTERTAAAVVRSGSAYLVLDASGVVFERVERRPDGVVLLVLANPGPGDAATVAALHVVAALTPQLRHLVKQVDAPSPTDLQLELTDGRVVFWGDPDRSDDKARAATAVLGRATKRIDVSSPDEIAAS
jgi:cell division protein FtsQ